jgi:hypothetical protein
MNEHNKSVFERCINKLENSNVDNNEIIQQIIVSVILNKLEL